MGIILNPQILCLGFAELDTSYKDRIGTQLSYKQLMYPEPADIWWVYANHSIFIYLFIRLISRAMKRIHKKKKVH